jgi:hypothetical protein
VYAGLFDGLGANPVEKVTHETGAWALRFLILSLAVTPVRRVSGWRALSLERRTFGLFAFAYASLHFSTYLGLDLGFDWSFLAEDIAERPYITIGFATFVILLVLAATSTRAAEAPGPTLEVAASPRLPGRDRRSRALPVARKGGPARAADLRGGPRVPARRQTVVDCAVSAGASFDTGDTDESGELNAIPRRTVSERPIATTSHAR